MFHIILDGKSTRSIQNVLKKEFQRLYSDETAIIQLDDICCPHCGKKGSLRHHGFYMRCLIVCGICFTVSIHRLRCYECGHTHALMPSFIIPYEKKFCIDLLSLLNERYYDFRKYYLICLATTLCIFVINTVLWLLPFQHRIFYLMSLPHVTSLSKCLKHSFINDYFLVSKVSVK